MSQHYNRDSCNAQALAKEEQKWYALATAKLPELSHFSSAQFEGQSNRSFISYLYHAKGFAGEVRSQLYIAFDRGYVTDDELGAGMRLAEKTSRLIAGFITYLEKVAG